MNSIAKSLDKGTMYKIREFNVADLLNLDVLIRTWYSEVSLEIRPFGCMPGEPFDSWQQRLFLFSIASRQILKAALPTIQLLLR